MTDRLLCQLLASLPITDCKFLQGQNLMLGLDLGLNCHSCFELDLLLVKSGKMRSQTYFYSDFDCPQPKA